MTPITALYRQLEQRPDDPAFIAAGEVWSYRRLAGTAERLARALAARGLRPGDRVALHMANRPELAVAYYACLRLGAIAAPLNIRCKTGELRDLLRRLQPSVYLGEARLYPQVAPVETESLAANARYVVGGAVDDNRAQPWAALLQLGDHADSLPYPDATLPAVLLATSGTTGSCKFVTHTPATLSAMTESLGLCGFAEPQVAINAVPMVHMTGFALLLASIRFAAPMIVLETFDADAVLDAIETHRGSRIIGLPFMFAALIEAQGRRPRKVDSLRFCLCGGDVCPLAVQRVFQQLFGVPLYSIWAATEVVGSLIYGLQPGPVSRVRPGAEIRVANDNGAPVPHGEVGELLVRGPNVAIGYWAGPGRIDRPGPGGWYHTGDLMRHGEADELWFVGRKKDLIIRGGSNISPVEVERVLLAHPRVRDAAVVGVPDPVLGQRVVGAVRLAGKPGGAPLHDILAHTRERLADYKVPERLEIVDEIPRNALGKIDRRTLATRLAQAASEDSAAAG